MALKLNKLNRESLREQAKREREQESSQAFFVLQPGKNRIRILPPPPGSSHVWWKTGRHYEVGPDSRSFVCPAALDRNALCPIHQEIERLKASGDEDDRALAARMDVTIRYLYNVVDLDHPEFGIQTASFPVVVHRAIRALIEDEDGEYGDITDPYEGYDLIITRTGEGLKTRYDVRARRSPSPLPDVILQLLEHEAPPDLSTLVSPPSIAEMKAALYGNNGRRAAAEEEEPEWEDDNVNLAPVAPAPSVVVKRQPAERGTPAAKTAKVAAPPATADGDDEDEDADDDWDWEDED